MNPKHLHHGYTLIETIVVLVLLAILATTALITVSDNTIVINGAVQQISRDLRYTQSLSMSSQTRYRMNIGANVSSYTITTANGATIVSTESLPSGIVMSNNAALSNNLIVFDGKGIPYTNAAGTVRLASNAVITLSSSKGTSLTVTISPQTGAILP